MDRICKNIFHSAFQEAFPQPWVTSWNYAKTSPKHDWGLLKTAGSAKWSAASGWTDRETLLHALWDILAECPSPQWSIKQSVYCKVGLIPGEEEKWFLVTGEKLTLSSLWQLEGAGQILSDPFPWMGSRVGGGGLHGGNSNDSSGIFQCREWQGPRKCSLLLTPPVPPPSTGRLSGKHAPIKWTAGRLHFFQK